MIPRSELKLPPNLVIPILTLTSYLASDNRNFQAAKKHARQNIWSMLRGFYAVNCSSTMKIAINYLLNQILADFRNLGMKSIDW